MSAGRPHHYGHSYTFFFHDFIHVYSPRAGADNPLGTKFWCQQEHLVTSIICRKFQKNLFEVWFYTIFFMILYMYIALGQGQTAPREKSFDVNRNLLSLHSLVASFKKCLWSLLSNFFYDLIHVCSPRGQNFDVNRKALSLYPLGERGGSVVECRTPEREVRGSKPTAAMLCPWAKHFTPRKYWLITQEAMAPSRHDWKIVDWDVKPQHKHKNFTHLLQVSKNSLWSLILYNCFHDLIHVYSPGAGGIQLPGDKVLMSTETSCHFCQQLLVSNHRRQ